jgi:hypothetical protein
MIWELKEIHANPEKLVLVLALVLNLNPVNHNHILETDLNQKRNLILIKEIQNGLILNHVLVLALLLVLDSLPLRTKATTHQSLSRPGKILIQIRNQNSALRLRLVVAPDRDRDLNLTHNPVLTVISTSPRRKGGLAIPGAKISKSRKFSRPHPSLSWSENLVLYYSKMPSSQFLSRMTNFGVHNLSGKEMSPLIRSVLSCGNKFLPTPITSPASFYSTLDNNFNILIRNLCIGFTFRHNKDRHYNPRLHLKNPNYQPKETQDLLEVKQLLLNLKHSFLLRFGSLPNTHSLRNLTRTQWETIIELRDHPDFIIIMADKNLGLILLLRLFYILHLKKNYFIKSFGLSSYT